MRLAHGMALAHSGLTSIAVMLDSLPTLTGLLDIRTVPVVFIEHQRRDGPVTEWTLLNALIATAQR